MWQRSESGLIVPIETGEVLLVTLGGASWADLDELVATMELLGGHVRKADKLPNPFTKAGFDEWIRRLEKAASRTIGAAERKAIRAGAKLAIRNWRNMTGAAITAAIKAMVNKMFTIPAAKIVQGAKALAASSGQLIKASKKGTAAREGLKIATTFDAVDKEMLAFTRAATEHYVRDQYGRMKPLHSKVARNHVADGIEKGFSSKVIGESLELRMSAMGLARSRGYWNTVSSIYAARARSWGQLRSYEQAGIEAFRITAVLDEHTTETCIFMHDKIIPVAPTIARYRETFDAEPEAVKWLQPFIQLGKDDDGELLYYKDREGNRQLVARVDEPARGQSDTIGRYSSALSTADMVDAGIGLPPWHGL
jgi:hypothetical protein